MNDAPAKNHSILGMVLVPAIITLAVLIVRFVGEINEGPEFLFGRQAGGGAPGAKAGEQGPPALIAITWLVPIFGFLFGRRLQKAGLGPGPGPALVGWAIAIGVVIGGIMACVFAGLMTFEGTPENPADPGGLVYGLAFVFAGIVLSIKAWPRLGLTLLAYGLLARIPVVILTFFLVGSKYDTHFTKLPKEFPAKEGNELLFNLCMPQMTAWIFFTVNFGMLCGVIGAFTAGNKPRD